MTYLGYQKGNLAQKKKGFLKVHTLFLYFFLGASLFYENFNFNILRMKLKKEENYYFKKQNFFIFLVKNKKVLFNNLVW